ncbi:undecaprenyldiphospho-muramoylpentapeptide beta-N-acetylglucosaminyltransferase [Legionella israelensis]|uniref:UDP-N-acetylglucosamine--N-acetylmuramyl-(pentapeptide) pyrophosphoryl-undecaprenol N-acetylglucosamine transferase n=1 Tax=Legionella israelensis TaxID=454 RepID=A0AAX1EI18_9GAMM|nr:undecaprenyldiphospho-muramoylpentapeptide beta-N-acetylglucosaminyltransferase [Legionella israelensis]QBR84444.1 undecaprenyldiphospho-muramoylpentapeptide beta-N-acetylglucosaminyltransferase [Legionella israelensis]
MKRCIVFTGGGTAGHVTPNLSLIEVFKAENWQVHYIGSANSVEQAMVDIPFHSVRSGKLRRYMSWQNFIDPFKIFWGMIQAWFLLHRLKPDVVFSKGGFVAVPVVIAAWLSRIPVVAHESDMSPGLANKLCFPFVKKICLTFPAAAKYFKNEKKTVVTGTPIRQQLFKGNREAGLRLCQFHEKKPCLLVMGGSMGAQSINLCIRKALPELTQEFQIIHLCGKDKLDASLRQFAGYCQFEYVHQELPDLLAASDVVISRAGANALYELLALNKPHILIPLTKKASRGDQIQNAEYFQQQQISYVIKEESLTPEYLMSMLSELMADKERIIDKIKELKIESATTTIAGIIKEQAYVQ